MNMLNLPSTMPKYIPLWKKYKPMILKLMLDASEGPQKYKFFSHEFKDANPNQKGGYSFTMLVGKGRALSSIKDSELARDLLWILQRSMKASELTYESNYEFTLDKQFQLHVTKIAVPSEESPEDTSAPDDKAASDDKAE